MLPIPYHRILFYPCQTRVSLHKREQLAELMVAWHPNLSVIVRRRRENFLVRDKNGSRFACPVVSLDPSPKSNSYLNPGGAVTVKLAVSELQAVVGSTSYLCACNRGSYTLTVACAESIHPPGPVRNNFRRKCSVVEL